MMEEEERNIVPKSRLGSALQDVKPHIPYVLPAVILFIVVLYNPFGLDIKYGTPMAWLAFWGLIGAIIFGCSAIITTLQWCNTSVRFVAEGTWYTTTSGMAKGEIVSGIDQFELPSGKKIDLSIVRVGGLTQFLNKWAIRDFYIGPKGCIEVIDMLEIARGDPCVFTFWQLPDKIQEKFAIVIGGKVTVRLIKQFHEDRSLFCLNFISYDSVKRDWVGERVSYTSLKDDKMIITKLRNELEKLKSDLSVRITAQPINMGQQNAGGNLRE